MATLADAADALLDAADAMADAADALSRLRAPPTCPPWLVAALGEIGTLERRGGEDNPRIVEYHGATRGGPAPDAVPWCASFVNWCLQQAGIRGTRTKRARDFLAWDGAKHLEHPEYGCLVVLWRGKVDDGYSGHVGFVAGWDEDTVYILGGNQRDRVCVRGYSTEKVLGYLRPSRGSR